MTVHQDGEALLLLPQKAIYWQKEKLLMLSDAHLAKDAHFRKHGIAIPNALSDSTLNGLSDIIAAHSPERLLILGDMFHSDWNRGVEKFIAWRKSFASLSVELVEGNHDVLGTEKYIEMGILSHGFSYTIGPFFFIHEDDGANEKFTFSGHIHPAIKLRGKARQVLRIPCFWWQPKAAVLPAFGAFTGNHSIKAKKKDKVYGIAGDEVMEIQ